MNKDFYIICCDDCGKTMLFLTGSKAKKLNDIINNDASFIDNTKLQCNDCIRK